MHNVHNNVFQKAVELYRQGRYTDVEALCQEILKQVPGEANTLNLMGLAAQTQNQHQTAVMYLSRAIKSNPKETGFYNNIANSYMSLGQPALAIEALKEALKTCGESANLLFNLALLHKTEPLKAIPYLERLLEKDPGNAQIVNLMISLLLQSGNREKALMLAEKSTAYISDDASLYFNLGLLLSTENTNKAIAYYQKALQYTPDFTKAHTNLGALYFQMGNFRQAIAHYKKVTENQPHAIEGWTSLCTAYLQGKNIDDALSTIRHALTLHPSNADCLNMLSECLEHIPPRKYDAALVNDFLSCLDSTQLALEGLRAMGEQIIWQQLNNALDRYNQPAQHVTTKDFCWQQLNDPAIIKTLQRLGICSLRTEHILTSLRKQLCQLFATHSSLDAQSLPFLAALAEQCFYNEYVYTRTDSENKTIHTLQTDIEHALAQDQSPNEYALMLLACYLPLYQLGNAALLVQDTYLQSLPVVKRVLDCQVSEPLAEERIKPLIKKLTPIDGKVSREVQSQYETNPYPRWTTQAHIQPVTAQNMVTRPSPWLPVLPEHITHPDILIAGCGTGRESIAFATKHPNARLTAVDLSSSSLAYAIRKANEFGIKNITWGQADLLSIGHWTQRFDIVISSGVLHHLSEPMQGWQVITGLLKPGGIMNIGLYSTAARQPIIAARRFIQEKGYSSTAEGIRQCRQDIMGLPNKHPASGCIRYGDFFTLSNCRDLIFHVQEHCYTVPMIRESLQILNLDFISMDVPEEVRQQFFSQYGEKAFTGMHALDCWEEFEKAHPDTFMGMYQFWLRKPD